MGPNNIQANLVSAGCGTAACDSISGELTTDNSDYRIRPAIPTNSYNNEGVGVNGAFNPLSHSQQKQGYFGWKTANSTSNFGGNYVPFNFSTVVSHQPPAGPYHGAMTGMTFNYLNGNDDTLTGSRQNYQGLKLFINSAGGQQGGLLDAESWLTGDGDNVGLVQYLQCTGHNQGDNEGCEFYRRFAFDQVSRFGIQLNASPTLQSPAYPNARTGIWLLAG
ncbi:hypothetical protein AB4043_19875, partial [Terriglobus sp. YAF25]